MTVGPTCPYYCELWSSHHEGGSSLLSQWESYVDFEVYQSGNQQRLLVQLRPAGGQELHVHVRVRLCRLLREGHVE